MSNEKKPPNAIPASALPTAKTQHERAKEGKQPKLTDKNQSKNS